MRSIGKRNIALIKQIAMKVFKENDKLMSYRDDNIIAIVSAKLPDRLWDTWECADSEINRIILDAKLQYDRSN